MAVIEIWRPEYPRVLRKPGWATSRPPVLGLQVDVCDDAVTIGPG
jgi:hypothetical protein